MKRDYTKRNIFKRFFDWFMQEKELEIKYPTLDDAGYLDNLHMEDEEDEFEDEDEDDEEFDDEEDDSDI